MHRVLPRPRRFAVGDEDLDPNQSTSQEDEEMASERIETPRRAYDGDQPIVAATKIHGLGGKGHANARRQRQHRDRRASINAVTYATSVPVSTCTCKVATWMTIPCAAAPSKPRLAETVTGKSRTAVSLVELRRDAPSFHRHQYNVERRIPRRRQNDSTGSPDPDSSSRMADLCSGLLRARIPARPLPHGQPAGSPLEAWN